MSGELEVYQYLYPRGGGQAQQGRRIGTFDYHQRHGHLQTFARYQLWSPGPQGEPLAVVATNDKVGFCLLDIKPISPERPSTRAAAPTCRASQSATAIST